MFERYTQRFEHMSLMIWKRQFIGLRFFDAALHVEAKGVSEETTGELSQYTYLPVTRVLGSCDCQKCLVHEAF